MAQKGNPPPSFPARTEIHPSLLTATTAIASSSRPKLPENRSRADGVGPVPSTSQTPASNPNTGGTSGAASYHQTGSETPNAAPREPSISSNNEAEGSKTGGNIDQDGQDAEDSIGGAQPAGSSADGSKEKPRAYIACQTCRSRKVKCDGVRPICTNCSKRRTPCNYDVVPRRRGPDRNPGTRQRGPKGSSASKKRKTGEGPANSDGAQRASSPPPPSDPPTQSSSGQQSHSFRPNDELPHKRKTTIVGPDGHPVSVTVRSDGAGPWPNDPPPAYSFGPGIAGPSNGPLPPQHPPLQTSPDRSRISLANLLSPSVSGRPSNPEPPSKQFFRDGTAYTAVIEAYDGSAAVFASAATKTHHPIEHYEPYASPALFVTGAGSSSSVAYGWQYPEQGYVNAQWPTSSAPYSGGTIVPVEEETTAYSEASYGYGAHAQAKSNVARGPSLEYSRNTWWDVVLSLYDPSSRYNASCAILSDLQAFFRIASPWLSFINVPMFFNLYHHAEHRSLMQPALVVGCLAYSCFMQGSEMEGGVVMRRKAAQLKEFAQSAFDASYNAGWLDVPLGQAAWVLTLYEVSAHPDTTGPRMTSAVVQLDNVIRALGLTRLDADSPRVAMFSPGDVPALGRPFPEGFLHPPGHSPPPLPMLEDSRPRPQVTYQAFTQQTPFDSYRAVANVPNKEAGCPCTLLSLGTSPEAVRATPLWLVTPKWDPQATAAEIRREEARRLVWSSIFLVGGEAGARVARGEPQLDLHVAKPENYALLYPGETIYASTPSVDMAFSSKESTWALYARTMFLWVAATQMRDSPAAASEKANFAMKTWMETIAIEDALNAHHCDGEKATMYQAREYLFVLRMFISYGYRSYIPVPATGVDYTRLDREMAMRWLHQQSEVAMQIARVAMTDFHSPAAKILLKRPYTVWWTMSQISRALVLFSMDRSLLFAVDAVLTMLPVVYYLQTVWPCPEQMRRMGRLMTHVRAVCQLTGRTVPPPPPLSSYYQPSPGPPPLTLATADYATNNS